MSGRATGALLGLALAWGCSHDLDALRAPGGGVDAGRDAGGMDAGRDGGGADAGQADAGCACDDGIDCTADTCMPDGSCSNTPVNSACDDGLSCTLDTCSPTDGCASVAPTEPTVCDDGNPCTDDACDPSDPMGIEDGTGCIHPPVADGTDCGGSDGFDVCCDGSCRATDTSTEHCGGCYVACVSGTSCGQGYCDPSCAGPGSCPSGFVCLEGGGCECGGDGDGETNCPRPWQSCELGQCRGEM